MTMNKKFYGNINSFEDLQKERDKMRLSLKYVEDKMTTDFAYIKKEAGFKTIASLIFKNILPVGNIFSAFNGKKTYNPHSKSKTKNWIQGIPFILGTILPAVVMRWRKRR